MGYPQTEFLNQYRVPFPVILTNRINSENQKILFIVSISLKYKKDDVLFSNIYNKTKTESK